MSSAKHAEKSHATRKLVDIAQKARGRTPLKYELEVIPFFAGELPSGLEKISFVWERGAKMFVTDPEAVNPHTRAAFWKQYLRQTATLYKENGRLLPKEYSFKVQHVRGTGDSATRKTVGKVKVDMSQFCTEILSPVPQEVFLQLKPAGKLKLSVKATWLKDAKVDLDALTELSFTTHKSGEGAAAGEDVEQDLTGVHHKAGIIPAFVIPLSPEEQHAAIEQEKARLAAFQQAELVNIRRTIEDKLRSELNDVLASHNKTSWRDYLCCCLPRKQVVHMHTSTELARQHESERTLLFSQAEYQLR
eukprot:gene9982-10137_t